MAPSADASPPVSRFQNVVNCDNSCPVNSNCFLGLCVCHAGWQVVRPSACFKPPSLLWCYGRAMRVARGSNQPTRGHQTTRTNTQGIDYW
jgi:hypothetical protein